MLKFTIGRSESYNREILMDVLKRRGAGVTADTLTQAFLIVTAMPEYQLC